MQKYYNYGRNYNNIFIKNKSTITKYSTLSGDALRLLCSKPLDFICKPKSFREYKAGFKYLDTTYYSIVDFKLLEGYKTLYEDEYTNGLADSLILKLLYKNMLILERMHKCGVIHSDICSKNIMINEKHDLRMIDFDNSIVDDICSIDNNFNNGRNSLEVIKRLSMEQDKKDLMKIYLNRIVYGNFKEIPENDKLDDYKDMIKNLVNDITSNNMDVDKDYYFYDVIKNLINEFEKMECSELTSFELIKNNS